MVDLLFFVMDNLGWVCIGSAAVVFVIGISGVASKILINTKGLRIAEEQPTNPGEWIIHILLNIAMFLSEILEGLFSGLITLLLSHRINIKPDVFDPPREKPEPGSSAAVSDLEDPNGSSGR